MKPETLYSFAALMTRLTSNSWAVEHFGRRDYRFVPVLRLKDWS